MHMGTIKISNLNSTLVWSIAKKVSPYSNKVPTTPSCKAPNNYHLQGQLLNKIRGLIFNCRHTNEFFLRNYNTNHWRQLLDN